jgi:hypothetical protein
MGVRIHCSYLGVYRLLWPCGGPEAIHVVGSGAVRHATRDSHVGTACSYCSKGYPCFRVLTDALGSIHSSNDKSTQVKVNLISTKDKMKEAVSTNGEKFRAPISHSYLCDYMLTWDSGKLVVKYVGAYT